MSTVPYPHRLLELMTRLDLIAPDTMTPGSRYLEQALAEIVSALPSAQSASLYRLSGASAEIIVSTDPNASNLSASAHFSRALESRLPSYDDGSRIWSASIPDSETNIGLLEVVMKETTPAANDMSLWLQQIAGKLSVLLRTDRLLEKARQQARQLQQVSRLTGVFHIALDMRTILEIALSESVQLVPVDRMSIALVDESDGTLRTAALHANGDNYITLTNGAAVSMAEATISRAWDNQEQVYIPDAVNEAALSFGETPELRSLLVTPVMARGRRLGLVTVGCSRSHAYTEQDISVFHQFTALLAAALDNATAFTRSRRLGKNETLLNDISGHLQQQLDVVSVMRVAATDLGNALGARRARVRLGTFETKKWID